MARPLRIEFADATYHITSRGNDQRELFSNDMDHETFLAFLGKAAKRFDWSITAWVLMTNHYHFVVQTRMPNLSRGMQWLNGTYAGWFNRTYKRSGHLFQGRFHAFLIEKASYFTEVLRYVALNPVRAQMVDRPEAYVRSSYRAAAGLDTAPDWFDLSSALAPFGGNNAEGRTNYQSFVDAKVSSTERLWDQVTNAIYLGTEGWTKEMRKLVESKPRSTDFPVVQRAVGRPKMAEIVLTVARIANVSPDVIRTRRGGSLRGLAAWLGWNEGWATLASIAAALRLRSEGYISTIIRRFEEGLSEHEELLTQLDAAVAALRA